MWLGENGHLEVSPGPEIPLEKTDNRDAAEATTHIQTMSGAEVSEQAVDGSAIAA